MANLYTNVNGELVSNELTPALIAALNKIAAARYDMETTPVYVYDNTGRAYYVATLFDENRRRVSYGNGKTGFPSVNTLAGACTCAYSGSLPAVIRALFPDIKGTCPETCPGCYALPITRNFIPAITTILNTIETERNAARFYRLVEKELFDNPGAPCPDTVRIHDSGEFLYQSDIIAAFEFAARHPHTTFYSYSKSALVRAAYEAGTIPENMHFACSPWIKPDGTVLCAPVGNMYQFIYDDGSNREFDALPHCPAVNVYGERTGIQCKQCGLCKRAEKGKRVAVYAHGAGAPDAAAAIAARGGAVRGIVLSLETVAAHRAAKKAARKAARAAKRAARLAKKATAATTAAAAD